MPKERWTSGSFDPEEIREMHEKYEAKIAELEKSNANVLRVWGESAAISKKRADRISELEEENRKLRDVFERRV